MFHEYVRATLISAFSDYGHSCRNQIEILKDMALGSKFNVRAKRLMDDGNSSFLIDAEVVKTLNFKKFVTSKPLINDFEFQLSDWRKAYKKLPAIEYAWISFCYKGDLKFDYQIMICNQIWDSFLASEEHTKPKMNSKSKAMCKALVWLAVQEQSRILKGLKPFYSYSDLSRLMSISTSVFNQTYSSRWEKLLGYCLTLDISSLECIERLHNREKITKRIQNKISISMY